MRTTHVPIVVRDQETALRYYTEMLGLEKLRTTARSGGFPGNRRRTPR
jgi:catechol 2,3-dioxygenase-like lactoylglutathione lyase family enzyme